MHKYENIHVRITVFGNERMIKITQANQSFNRLFKYHYKQKLEEMIFAKILSLLCLRQKTPIVTFTRLKENQFHLIYEMFHLLWFLISTKDLVVPLSKKWNFL